MFTLDTRNVGLALFRARRNLGAGCVDLRHVRSLDEARDIQEEALSHHDATPVGYTLAATSPTTARLLNCPRPVVGKLVAEHVHDSGVRLRLPYGMLGVGAQLVVRMGLSPRMPLNLGSVSDAVLSCWLGLQVLGRRTASGVPLNEWTATADYGLDVACVIGEAMEAPKAFAGVTGRISLLLDDVTIGRGSDIGNLMDPLATVLSLARALHDRGTRLEAGDTVAVGSCTGLTQVVPGQRVRAIFDGRCQVVMDLT